MLKNIFKKKDKEGVLVEMNLSIEDLQTLSDFVASKLNAVDSKKKKKMSFNEYYTKPTTICFKLVDNNLYLAEDLSKLYEGDEE